MSVSVNYTSKATVTEILEENVPAATTKTVQHTGYDTVATASSETTPAVTKCALFEQALDAGAATIDLTALVGTNGIAVDGTGLRVQFLKFKNKSTNANVMSITQGAATGYDGFGTSFFIELLPGAEVLVCAKDGGADISGTNKMLDLAGTLAQVAEITIVLG